MTLIPMAQLKVAGSGIGCHAGLLSGLRYYDKDGNTDPKPVIRDFCAYYYGNNYKFAFVLFGDNASNKEGDQLAKLIEDEELGTVYATEPMWNPNYHGQPEHKSKVWIWTLNHDKLAEWWAKNPLPPKTPTKNIYQPF